MAALEVNLKLLLQLQAMDFSFVRAAQALHSTRNVSVEEAVNWIVDHENDPFIDQAPSVIFDIDIESSSSFVLSEETRKKTQELMERMQQNEAQKERHQKEEMRRERMQKNEAQKEERRRNGEPIKKEKEEEKSSRKKIPRKLEQDKVERRSKVELLDERSEPSKSSFTSSLPSTMSSKKAECMRECLKSLKHNYKDDIYKVRRAFQTLLIYVGNVAKHPDNEKFRKIRLTNPIFQERVGSLKGGIEFLEVCGFERRREGGLLYLPRHKVDVNSLKSAGFLLNSALSNPFFGVLSP